MAKIRYATKAVVIDGRQFNKGDIIPNGLADVATVERHSKVVGADSSASVQRSRSRLAGMTPHAQGPRGSRTGRAPRNQKAA